MGHSNTKQSTSCLLLISTFINLVQLILFEILHQVVKRFYSLDFENKFTNPFVKQ